MQSSNLALGLSDFTEGKIDVKASIEPVTTPSSPVIPEQANPSKTSDARSTERKLPPMLEQYVACKNDHQDCLVFFQVGDFYELFFDDARTVSEKLNLTLTSRDKSSDDPIPMCGVPISAVDGYIERLVDLGFSICVVSQLNSQYASRLPTFYKESDTSSTKPQIQRAITRIITPGVRLLGNSEQNGIVAALCIESEDRVAIAWTTVQSGVVIVREDISLGQLPSELMQIGVSEVVIPRICLGQTVDLRTSFVRGISDALGKTAVKVRSSQGSALDGQAANLLQLSLEGKKSVSLLKAYVEETTLGAKLGLTSIQLEQRSHLLQISAATRDNLELIKNAHDGTLRGTLLETINETRSLVGRRLLSAWICSPSCDASLITIRQDAVEKLKDRGVSSLQNSLSALSDLERHAARLELNVIGPRELFDLRNSLKMVPAIQAFLSASDSLHLHALEGQLSSEAQLLQILEERLSDDPPMLLQEGSVIREGFNEALDELRGLRQEGTSWLDQFEQQEKVATGIPSLKVKFNLVVGYFIEITRTHLLKVPEHYKRRQSTATCERFTTDALSQREKLVLGANEKEAQLEKQLYQELKTALQKYTAELRRISKALAEIDCLQSLAYIAIRLGWIKPEIVEEPILIIEGGEHPVLSKMLEGRFIPNSLDLQPEPGNCIVLTGPNMGGKSTYLRQAGLITVLAQIGSFVPAKRAVIGLCDKLFARIGASDNIVEGESTFMVEMRETAQILANATHRSVLLIDEVGRGTATSDGLAIAQAVLEWISESLQCRTLFATHFHELTNLQGKVKGLKTSCVKVVEQDGEIIFTHEIIEGAAAKSYGLEVAKLAGVPASVLLRAEKLLDGFDCAQKRQQEGVAGQQDPQVIYIEKRVLVESKIESQVALADLDSMSPRLALEFLYSLKRGA